MLITVKPTDQYLNRLQQHLKDYSIIELQHLQLQVKLNPQNYKPYLYEAIQNLLKDKKNETNI